MATQAVNKASIASAYRDLYGLHDLTDDDKLLDAVHKTQFADLPDFNRFLLASNKGLFQTQNVLPTTEVTGKPMGRVESLMTSLAHVPEQIARQTAEDVTDVFRGPMRAAFSPIAGMAAAEADRARGGLGLTLEQQAALQQQEQATAAGEMQRGGALAASIAAGELGAAVAAARGAPLVVRGALGGGLGTGAYDEVLRHGEAQPADGGWLDRLGIPHDPRSLVAPAIGAAVGGILPVLGRSVLGRLGGALGRVLQRRAPGAQTIAGDLIDERAAIEAAAQTEAEAQALLGSPTAAPAHVPDSGADWVRWIEQRERAAHAEALDARAPAHNADLYDLYGGPADRPPQGWENPYGDLAEGARFREPPSPSMPPVIVGKDRPRLVGGTVGPTDLSAMTDAQRASYLARKGRLLPARGLVANPAGLRYVDPLLEKSGVHYDPHTGGYVEDSVYDDLVNGVRYEGTEPTTRVSRGTSPVPARERPATPPVPPVTPVTPVPEPVDPMYAPSLPPMYRAPLTGPIEAEREALAKIAKLSPRQRDAALRSLLRVRDLYDEYMAPRSPVGPYPAPVSLRPYTGPKE